MNCFWCSFLNDTAFWALGKKKIKLCSGAALQELKVFSFSRVIRTGSGIVRRGCGVQGWREPEVQPSILNQPGHPFSLSWSMVPIPPLALVSPSPYHNAGWLVSVRRQSSKCTDHQRDQIDYQGAHTDHQSTSWSLKSLQWPTKSPLITLKPAWSVSLQFNGMLYFKWCGHWKNGCGHQVCILI